MSWELLHIAVILTCTYSSILNMYMFIVQKYGNKTVPSCVCCYPFLLCQIWWKPTQRSYFFFLLSQISVIWFLSNFVYLPVITSFTYHILNLGIRLGFIFFILFCVYTVVNWSFNFESLYIINIDKVGKRDVWSRTFPPNSHMTFVYIWNWIHFVNSEYCVYTSEAFDKAFYR